jgi:hypothetical protein
MPGVTVRPRARSTIVVETPTTRAVCGGRLPLGERDENIHRKNFLPSERVAIADAIFPLKKKAARHRQGRPSKSGPRKIPEMFPVFSARLSISFKPNSGGPGWWIAPGAEGMPTQKPVRLTPAQSGSAGAFFVAAELSRRRYIATVTVRNARGIDLLVANPAGTRSVSIQVKTNQDSAKAWLLDDKAETLAAETLFYVFVNLNGQQAPSFHIVESAIVAEYCLRTHREWIAGVKRDGSPRKNTAMREFRDEESAYLNAWHRLGLDD